MAQTDIEIKKVESKEVAISTKRTLYCCITWNGNGVMFSNSPTTDKRWQEDYALSQSKFMEHTCVYSFDIDIPNFKTQ
jgi:hypothetical protein